MKEKRLNFKLGSDGEYFIINNDFDKLGFLEKRRVGAWFTWCLFLYEDCYLTAGCQDEVREFTKKLNLTANKKNV